MKARKGFTLVEILIVVVILGILAAIVIPQFTNASTEAKESSLMSNLQTLRSQVELYKIQHNDDLPGVTPSVATPTGEQFVTALTTQTKQDGTAGDKFGPYLQKIPSNPFSVIEDTVVTLADKSYGDSSLGVNAAIDGSACAWNVVFDTTSANHGLIQPADGGTNNATGVLHSDY